MTDLAHTIAAKSDQLNADDLIAGSKTITVTRVAAAPNAADQPVDVFFQGDNGKPYKPCKSMRRVMVALWGADANVYPGRRMTLYRDPEVMFGGLKVGGIRISHMSHIAEPRVLALTATRGSKKAFTVRPLATGPVDPSPDPDEPSMLPLAHDATDAEITAWGEELRTLIKRASTPGLATTWSELNADTLLRVAARNPRLASWIRAALPVHDNEIAADVNPAATGDAPSGGHTEGASPPLQNRAT